MNAAKGWIFFRSFSFILNGGSALKKVQCTSFSWLIQAESRRNEQFIFAFFANKHFISQYSLRPSYPNFDLSLPGYATSLPQRLYSCLHLSIVLLPKWFPVNKSECCHQNGMWFNIPLAICLQQDVAHWYMIRNSVQKKWTNLNQIWSSDFLYHCNTFWSFLKLPPPH